MIGGCADTMLKCPIKATIELVLAGSGSAVRIATPADNFNGDNPKNIVNRLANGNGLQIEQSQSAREGYGQQLWDLGIFTYRHSLFRLPKLARNGMVFSLPNPFQRG